MKTNSMLFIVLLIAQGHDLTLADTLGVQITPHNGTLIMGKNATFNCTASLSGSDPSYFIAINGRIFPLESAEMSKQRFEIQSPSNKIRLLIIRNTTSDLNGTTLICKQCKKIFGIKVCQEDSIKMTVLKPRAEYDVITTSPLQPLTPINCSIQYIYSEKLIILTWQSLVEGEYKESSFFTYNVFKDNDTKAILSGRRNATVPIGLIYREYVSYPQGLESEASFTLYVRTVIGNVTSETCIERLVYTSEDPDIFSVKEISNNTGHSLVSTYADIIGGCVAGSVIVILCVTIIIGSLIRLKMQKHKSDSKAKENSGKDVLNCKVTNTYDSINSRTSNIYEEIDASSEDKVDIDAIKQQLNPCYADINESTSEKAEEESIYIEMK